MRSSGKTSKKLTSGLPEEYTTIAIDQTRKAVGCTLYRAWFPESERVSLPYWKTYENIKLLGTLTEIGDTFFIPVADSFTSDVMILFLKALQTNLVNIFTLSSIMQRIFRQIVWMISLSSRR